MFRIQPRSCISAGRRVALILTMLSLALSLVSCGSKAHAPAEEGEVALSLSSAAFQEGEWIPIKYTCDGEDVSPPLAWGQPPEQTQCFALIVDDPDAPLGMFTHWVLFNLPANIRQLPEGIPTLGQLENGALQGKNDFGETGYSGPCPPPGATHHYRFTLYALDKPLDLMTGASKKQVLDAIKGHILAQGRLTGAHQR
jgi:Raf kinase inhibitor-like YbhB/YbcL family protein